MFSFFTLESCTPEYAQYIRACRDASAKFDSIAVRHDECEPPTGLFNEIELSANFKDLIHVNHTIMDKKSKKPRPMTVLERNQRLEGARLPPNTSGADLSAVVKCLFDKLPRVYSRKYFRETIFLHVVNGRVFYSYTRYKTTVHVCTDRSFKGIGMYCGKDHCLARDSENVFNFGVSASVRFYKDRDNEWHPYQYKTIFAKTQRDLIITSNAAVPVQAKLALEIPVIHGEVSYKSASELEYATMQDKSNVMYFGLQIGSMSVRVGLRYDELNYTEGNFSVFLESEDCQDCEAFTDFCKKYIQYLSIRIPMLVTGKCGVKLDCEGPADVRRAYEEFLIESRKSELSFADFEEFHRIKHNIDVVHDVESKHTELHGSLVRDALFNHSDENEMD